MLRYAEMKSTDNKPEPHCFLELEADRWIELDSRPTLQQAASMRDQHNKENPDSGPVLIPILMATRYFSILNHKLNFIELIKE